MRSRVVFFSISIVAPEGSGALPVCMWAQLVLSGTMRVYVEVWRRVCRVGVREIGGLFVRPVGDCRRCICPVGSLVSVWAIPRCFGSLCVRGCFSVVGQYDSCSCLMR